MALYKKDEDQFVNDPKPAFIAANKTERKCSTTGENPLTSIRTNASHASTAI